jgi:glycosyl transferase family 25
MTSPILDYFDHLYVINLPSRKDRYRLITNELEINNLPISSGKITIFPASQPETADRWRSAGARGCFMSHLRVLKLAHESGANRIVIVEDDLAINPRFSAQQASLVNSLKQQPNWGVCYLGHQIELPPSDDNFVPYSDWIGQTHFLAFQAPIIERMIQFLETLLTRPAGDPEGGPMDVDGAYSTYRLQNLEVLTLMANPSFGNQRSSLSDITPPKIVEQIPFLRTATAAAYNIKDRLTRRRN